MPQQQKFKHGYHQINKPSGLDYGSIALQASFNLDAENLLLKSNSSNYKSAKQSERESSKYGTPKDDKEDSYDHPLNSEKVNEVR